MSRPPQSTLIGRLALMLVLFLGSSAQGCFTHARLTNVANLWDAINPNGHAAQTTDALFDIPLHPIQTIQNLAHGVEKTFANFGAGFGSGNFEKAGEAGFGIALMLLPELRLGKLGEAGQVGRVLEAAESGVQTLDASLIRFSQSNVRSSLPDIVASMKANGWQGAPIDVVRMPDGLLTAVDNTRLAAASLSKTPVQAVIRGFDEAFPAARAGGNLQGTTWGEAVLNRIGNQRPGWQQLYPSGSPFTGVHPSTSGFSP